jgi:hypothetical protein
MRLELSESTAELLLVSAILLVSITLAFYMGIG